MPTTVVHTKTSRSRANMMSLTAGLGGIVSLLVFWLAFILPGGGIGADSVYWVFGAGMVVSIAFFVWFIQSSASEDHVHE